MDAVTKKALQRLGVFTTFLGTAAGRTGFQGGAITEVGIPQARADSSPPAAYVTDVPLWQALYDAWYTAADDAGLWVTGWSSGPQWGDYNLAMHTNDSSYLYPTGTNVDKFMSPGGIDVVEAHPPQGASPYRRGVNYSGMEFGHKTSLFTNANSGGLNDGTVRAFYVPTGTDAAVLATRRLFTVRLCISWERLQPTLLGALNTTYLGYITTFVNACAANGIGCILDLHNYARYEYNDAGTKRVLVLRVESGLDTATTGPTGEDTGAIGPEYLIDVWRRLSAVYRTNTGVVAYELMNEPHDVKPSAGTFTGTTLNDFNSGTQSWTGGIGVTVSASTTSPYEGSGILHGVASVGGGGGFTNFEMERGSVSGTGNVLRGRVRLNGTPTGTWNGRLCWVDSGFATHQGPAVPLTPGAWTLVTADFAADAIAGSAINLKLQIQCNSPAAGASINWDLDVFERGSLSGVYTDVTAWENITQQVLTDLRTRPDNTALRDTKTVLVAGMGWNVLGWNHSTAWLTEPSGLEGTHLYVTHHYFDTEAGGNGEGEGVYQTATKRYSNAETYALSQGFTDDADVTAPVITSIVAGSLTASGATITWTTTGQTSDSRVEYGLNSLPSGVYGSSTVRDATLVTSHSVALTGLTAGTVYRFRVRSRDAAGNLTIGTPGTFTTTGGGDVTPPVVSSVSSGTPTSTGATITWTTDELADSRVEYGLTTSYGSTTATLDTSPRVTSHSVPVSGLASSTLYHYRVISRDAALNTTTDSDRTFTTAAAGAAVISGVTVTSATSTTATITCTTDVPATVRVEYGLTTGYGTNTAESPTGTSHSRSLSSLTPNTLYHYRLRASN